MRVKLIVTGDLEKIALHRSLARWFPETGSGEPIDFVVPSKVQGPTCNPLDDGSETIGELVRTFADALVWETLAGSDRRSKPDLVVGIDDLELCNHHQPEVVIRCIRRGVVDSLARDSVGERRREALRTKCSFHLLVPMAEAYFFGERAALERVGVAANVQAQLGCEDLEQFETNDPVFLAGHPDDGGHPKRYLEDLLRRSGRSLVRPYRETRDGRLGLETLDWPGLGPPQSLGFARSLFEDLAEAFDVPNPLGEGALASATHPADRRDLVLRNL